MLSDWTYESDHDTPMDLDCRKIWHFAINVKTGERRVIDWSPYQPMIGAEFRLWLALGMPNRRGHGPLQNSDLLELAAEKLAA